MPQEHSNRSPSHKDISAARRFYGRVSAFSETRALSTLKSESVFLRTTKFEVGIPKNEAIKIVTRFSIEPIIAKTPVRPVPGGLARPCVRRGHQPCRS